jgi:hypothetical protein
MESQSQNQNLQVNISSVNVNTSNILYEVEGDEVKNLQGNFSSTEYI